MNTAWLLLIVFAAISLYHRTELWGPRSDKY